MTFVLKRDGVEVARIIAPQIERPALSKFVGLAMTTLIVRDAKGKRIGKLYLNLESQWTCEPSEGE
jgi:hypothetical protein